MTRLCLSMVTAGVLAFFALSAAAMHHEVKMAKKSGIGTYLTDAEGMTLYRFEKDSINRSACSGGCINNWPLFYRPQVAPPAGLKAEDFGSITREDGLMQTTFRGYPLYYFKGDVKPGDVRGQKVLDLWFVVNPDKFRSSGH